MGITRYWKKLTATLTKRSSTTTTTSTSTNTSTTQEEEEDDDQTRNIKEETKGITRGIVKEDTIRNATRGPRNPRNPRNPKLQLHHESIETINLVPNFSHYKLELPNFIKDTKLSDEVSSWGIGSPSSSSDEEELKLSSFGRSRPYLNPSGAGTLVGSVGHLSTPSASSSSDTTPSSISGRLLTSPHTNESSEYSFLCHDPLPTSHPWGHPLSSDRSHSFNPDLTSFRSPPLPTLRTTRFRYHSDWKLRQSISSDLTRPEFVSTETLVTHHRPTLYSSKSTMVLKNCPQFLPSSDDAVEDWIPNDDLLDYFNNTKEPLLPCLISDEGTRQAHPIIVQPPLDPNFQKAEILNFPNPTTTTAPPTPLHYRRHRHPLSLH